MADERETGWDIGFPPEAPWDAYYAALGRLVQMFGQTEVALHRILKDLVFDFTAADNNPLNWELLGALLGPMRVAPLRTSIKRILRVVEADSEIITEFDYAFQHLGEIHFFRDRVVHHGADASSFNEGSFLTSNDNTVYKIDQHDILIFDPEMMLNMSYDLTKIVEYMGLITDELLGMHLGDGYDLARLRTLRPSWRYRPSLLKREGPKHWSKPPVLPPPRSSSRRSRKLKPDSE